MIKIRRSTMWNLLFSAFAVAAVTILLFSATEIHTPLQWISTLVAGFFALLFYRKQQVSDHTINKQQEWMQRLSNLISKLATEQKNNHRDKKILAMLQADIAATLSEIPVLFADCTDLIDYYHKIESIKQPIDTETVSDLLSSAYKFIYRTNNKINYKPCCWPINKN